MDAKQILASASNEVTTLIENILSIEREYQYYQNIDGKLEQDIVDRILKAVEREVREE